MATNSLTRQAFGDPDPINPRASSFGDAAAASRDSSVQQVSTGAAGGPLSKLASSAQSRLAAPASGLETLGETTAPQGAANRMAGSGRSLVAAAGLGANPGGQTSQFQTPTVAHSGNDWTARENLRRMKMDANSLVHRSTWAPKGAGQAAANAYEKASLIDHAAMTGGQAKASLETMQQNAGLLREGMQQSGENARRSLADMAGIQRETIQQEGAARRQSLADMANMDRTLVEQSGASERTGLEAQSKGLIAAMQAQAAARKAPEGYRYTADGTRMEAIPGGPSDPNAPGGGKPLTDTQAKSLQFGARMQDAGSTIEELANEGVYEPGRFHKATGATALTNWTQSASQQRIEQAQNNFINALMRRESGAVIGIDEYANADKQYFPRPGDSDEVIEQKRRNRLLSTNGLLAEVPNAQHRVAQITPPKTLKPEAGGQATPQKVDSLEALTKLPSGATFVAPDGTVRIKP